MGWNLNDLTSSADASAAASNPTGFVFPARGTQHVFYRSTDDHIVELKWDRSGWQRLDLHAGAKAIPAVGEPVAFTCLRAGTQHVAYAGADGHVHELSSRGDGWQDSDLSAASGIAVSIAGNPAACVSEKHGTRHVFFRDAAGKVFELTSDGQSWRHRDLSSSAPGSVVAASNLAAVTYETSGARYVVYRGKEGHVHELSCDAGGWHAADLTAIVTGSPVAVGDPALYVFDGQGTRHVIYRSADGHVHELWCDGAGWRHENLTQQTNAPTATDDPTGYMFDLQGTQHVLYRATDSLVHELWWDVNGWHHDAPGGIGPTATGRAAGYSFEMQKTQHAVYRQPDGRIAELWWQPDGTGTGGAGKRVNANSIAMKWDPIVFDGGIPVGGSGALPSMPMGGGSSRDISTTPVSRPTT